MDISGRREAILKPRIFGEFLRKYDQHAIPRRDIARNVLVDIGVPEGRADEVLDQLRASALAAGFVEEIKGKQHIDLSSAAAPQGVDPVAGDEPAATVDETAAEEASQRRSSIQTATPDSQTKPPTQTRSARERKVFVTHGKNRDLIDPIKKLLEYGELEAVVSVEKQSVSKPVPEKVMDEMRLCGAAIIHVDAESDVTDMEGMQHVILNPNVLIEIGAAMAFYGRRFILLVRQGVKLPSNLQGLFEVRYPGGTLDADSTIRLLEAIKDIKNYALPSMESNPEGS